MRYLSIRREIDGSLPTVAELLRQKGEQDALRALSRADIEIAEVGYDNWNGGTELWTVFLRAPVSIFVSIEDRRIAGIISKSLELATGSRGMRGARSGPTAPLSILCWTDINPKQTKLLRSLCRTRFCEKNQISLETYIGCGLFVY